MFDQKDITDVKALLNRISNAVIVTHKNPDGDAVGSSLGLYHFLINRGVKATVITPNEFPDFLQWMPGSDSVIRYSADHNKAKEIVNTTEAIFILDLNQLARLDGLQAIIENSEAPKVLIDHHQEPDQIAEIMLSRPSASSTAEMVYHLVHALGEEGSLNKAAAECLYTGIMTDTGSFKYSCTSKSTHLAAAALMELGVDPASINQQVENNYSFDRLKLIGYTLSNKMRVLEDQHTCIMSLSSQELKDHNFKKGDTEGLVNYGLSMSGIAMSVFFAEQDGIIKISFRSIGDVHVNGMAKEHFNGGGHQNASGGMWPGSMEDAIEHFEKVLPKFIILE